MTIKHPEVHVRLTGSDRNGFMIACRVRRELERAGHREDSDTFFNEALSGDYDHLLTTCLSWVTVS